MRKQILLWVGLACLISIDVMGQNKYNDWATNQLQGMVKKVDMKRKVFINDYGYKNLTWVQTFNTNGYITESVMDSYIIRYEQAKDRYTTKLAVTDDWYQTNRFQIKVDSNTRSDIGGYTQYKNSQEVGGTAEDDYLIVKYTFDALGRLAILDNGNVEDLFDMNANGFSKIYSYKGNEQLPYKVKEDITYGGDGWEQTLIFKYESVDPSGNWLKRKVYFADNNKLLMEEARTIEYYPAGTTAATQPVAAAPIANRSPQFIGGNAAMKQFFAQNANPRKPAIASAGYGEIIVEFTVTPNGEIQNAKWKGRVLESLDKEALRMVEMMPKWKPGIIDGVPTEMYVQVGIRFFPQQEFRYIKATY